jgi:hypothetical protein
MKSCTSTAARSESSPDFYSLRRLASGSLPSTIAELQTWLSKHHKRGEWDGKLYVARSIFRSSQPPEFRQRGCSPNYHAGLWSLACCKHPMRAAKPFRGQVTNYTVPTFVFTLAKKDATEGSQALVSVAKITEHFETMGEYAKFLLEEGKPKLISSRLTRVHNDDGLLGWRFGDCHADEQGRVGAPDRNHVHGHGCWDHGQPCWKVDNDKTHLILISDKFLLWDRPVFFAKTTIKQLRHGKNLRADNLADVLSCK